MHTEVHQAKASLIAAMTVFLVMDTAVIAARVYVRAFMIRAFGWDDATLCVSHVCTYSRTLLHLACFCTRTAQTDANALGKLGFIIACTMGFISIYFGYAYDGPPEDWPNFDEEKAHKVSRQCRRMQQTIQTLTLAVDGSTCTPTS